MEPGSTTTTATGGFEQFRQELTECWRKMPGASLFVGFLALWVAYFHWLGNSTLGYINSPSLFRWMHWVYSQTDEDAIGFYVPLVVLALLWARRQEWVTVRQKVWWPALILLVGALLVHLLGYRVQQNRISIAAFFSGIYAAVGLFWGWRMLKAIFFPFFLFIFCIPVANHTEFLSFPLRMFATDITTWISHTILGVQVIQNGTQLFAPDRSYQYEVAAACSGIRSLTVISLLSLVVGFHSYKALWRRCVIVAAALPLAVGANVIRLCTIIIAAQAFGQNAGNYVHESWWMGLLPYALAIVVLLVLTRLVNRWSPETQTPDSNTAPGIAKPVLISGSEPCL